MLPENGSPSSTTVNLPKFKSNFLPQGPTHLKMPSLKHTWASIFATSSKGPKSWRFVAHVKSRWAHHLKSRELQPSTNPNGSRTVGKHRVFPWAKLTAWSYISTYSSLKKSWQNCRLSALELWQTCHLYGHWNWTKWLCSTVCIQQSKPIKWIHHNTSSTLHQHGGQTSASKQHQSRL